MVKVSTITNLALLGAGVYIVIKLWPTIKNLGGFISKGAGWLEGLTGSSTQKKIPLKEAGFKGTVVPIITPEDIPISARDRIHLINQSAGTQDLNYSELFEKGLIDVPKNSKLRYYTTKSGKRIRISSYGGSGRVISRERRQSYSSRLRKAQTQVKSLGSQFFSAGVRAKLRSAGLDV